MKRIGLPTIVGAVFLIGLLAAVETGLRTAAWLQAHVRIDRAVSESHSSDFLLVGDSILGTIRDPKSAAGFFLAAAASAVPDLKVDELSLGGLTSEEALKKVQQNLKHGRLGTVVFMVGKNDWVKGWTDATFGRLVHSPIGSLEMTKAALVLAADAQKAYLRWRPDREVRLQQADFHHAWALYGSQRIEAIQEFEEQLRKHPDYVRAIRALVHLYYLHWKLEEGIRYLESLKEISSEKPLIDVHIAYLKSDRLKEKGEKIELQEFGWEESVMSMSDQRLAFIARLRIAHIAGDANVFAREFRSMGPEQSDVFLPSTLLHLHNAVDLLLEKGVRVVVVDYPSHHAEPTRRAFKKYGDRVELYDSRSWLINQLPAEKLMAAFEVDCDHLEEVGAKIVGESLAAAILRPAEKR
jgi:hypothetical protein